MPSVQTESLPKNQTKLTITVPHDELVPFLEEAAKRVSETAKIPGFRPGKAGYDVVKVHVGEMKIYEEALESVVKKTFVEAVLGQKLDTVGSPAIDIVKLAPGNDLVYTATVTLTPAVEQLADWKSLKVDAKPVSVSDKDVDLLLKDLQRMQTKEVRESAGVAATKNHKVVVDMNMKKEGVPLEGGQATGHAIYLNENYYIPGLAEQVAGMKEGEQKSFTLTMPKENYTPQLAGAPVDFDITLKEIYQLDHPTLDDAFAKALGQKDLAALKAILKENVTKEKTEEETTRQEREALEAVAKATRFGDIPDLLLNEEINKMLEELKRGVEEQGLDFDTYMKNLKKTLPEIKLDLTPQAMLRIKVALILRAIATKENITAEAKEIDEELDRQAERYEDKDAKAQIYSPMYRDYVETILRNRKVIELLKKAIVKTA